jgi:peptidyl-tRNA hydrolase
MKEDHHDITYVKKKLEGRARVTLRNPKAYMNNEGQKQKKTSSK